MEKKSNVRNKNRSMQRTAKENEEGSKREQKTEKYNRELNFEKKFHSNLI